MPNKKINQLDSRVGVALTDLSLIGDPTSGTSFKLTLQDISTIMGVPGKFNQPTGTTAQYLRGDGSLATFPTIPSGTVTSVGLSMPSAFAVANSPVTSSGTLAVTGAGTAEQYIRGDGQLANFPTNGGGGSSVNYYLNGSVSQGTFGGDTYYEMSKTPIIGAGTNFTRTNAQGNGYIASFITDAGDPALLNIPGGNWNLEFYFNASSGGGTPRFYGEIYKVSSSNVFTLVASGSTNPEGITQGTVVDQYFTSIAIAQTSLLATDRLAVRIYVIPDGRNITLHTENSNLCEVLTTFSTGLNALNGLTAQVQYFATGTSGTDFAISSATDTHTFNLPTASGTNRGALSSADWTTFNNKVSSNIYTADGTLTSARTLTYTGNDLTFFTVRPSVGNRYITFHNSGRVTFNGQTENTSYEVNVNGGLLAGAGSMIGGTSGVQFDSGNLRLIFQGWSSVSFVRGGGVSVLYSDGTTASLGNGSARLNISAGSFSTNGGGVGTGANVYSIGAGTNNITTASYTVSIGSENLYGVTTGSTNIAIGGRWSGSGASRGNTGNHSSSIFLGVGTGAATNTTALTNTTIIGHDILTDASNTVILGRSDQNVTIGGVLNAGYKLDVNGTARVQGTGYFSDSVGIGATALTGSSLRIDKNLTGATTAYGIRQSGTIQSDVTSAVVFYATETKTQAATFNIADLYYYQASQGSLGAGSSITNQYGFYALSNMTGATNNYGFYGNIGAGTNRWNLYMSGTANNYLAGSLGIGATSLTNVNLRIEKNITGNTVAFNIGAFGTVLSDVTNQVRYVATSVNTQAASFTLGNAFHFYAEQGTIGLGSSITNQYGYFVNNTLIGATNNFGFYGNIAAGTNRWNLYMSGTADNYLAGKLLIGTTTVSTFALDVNGTARVSYSDNNYGQGFYIQNTNTGTSAITGMLLRTSAGTDVAAFSYYPSNYIEVSQRNTAVFATVTTQKLGFQACASGGSNAAQDIWFSNKGGQFNATLFSTGNLLIQNGGTFSDNGNRLQVTGNGYFSGRVGVGTSNPQENVHISATNAGLDIDGTTSSRTYYNRSGAYIWSTGLRAGDTKFYIYDERVGERFTIDDSGNVGIINATPTAALDTPASTTSRATMRIRSGVAPTTPNNGDIWFDGTDLKMRIGGVTKTFTLV